MPTHYIYGSIIEYETQIPFSGIATVTNDQYKEMLDSCNEAGIVNIRDLSFSVYSLEWSPDLYNLHTKITDRFVFLDEDKLLLELEE